MFRPNNQSAVKNKQREELDQQILTLKGKVTELTNSRTTIIEELTSQSIAYYDDLLQPLHKQIRDLELTKSQQR